METKKVQGEETRTEHNVHSTQEKTNLKGAANSGVTSDDPARKEEIEKKGTSAKDKEQSSSDKDKRPLVENNLTREDIPDSTNESTGIPGSGQRQDSN